MRTLGFQFQHQVFGVQKNEETINRLLVFLDLRSQNYTKLYGKKFEKRVTRKEIGNSGNNLAGFDHFKYEELAELK